ncbi:unnamed protein product, partial [Owenia fusiformis]
CRGEFCVHFQEPEAHTPTSTPGLTSPPNQQGDYCLYCASRGWRNTTCSVFDDKPFLASMSVQDVTLKTQVSRTQCMKNKWGLNYEAGTIWVAKGCRGEFCVHFQEHEANTPTPTPDLTSPPNQQGTKATPFLSYAHFSINLFKKYKLGRQLNLLTLFNKTLI